MTDAYLGEIAIFPYSRIPVGWLPCDGRLLEINKNQALYSLIGTTYGGDAKVNFRLPDLRGRTPLGMGVLNQNQYSVGTYGGAEAVALTAASVPPHTHGMTADNSVGKGPTITNNYFAQVVTSAADTTPKSLYAVPSGAAPALVPLNPASISTVGAGQAHNNMQPSLALSFCICTVGIYPPRP